MGLAALLSMFAVAVVTLGYEEMRVAHDGSVLQASSAGITHEIQSSASSWPVAGASLAPQRASHRLGFRISRQRSSSH
jgi:hypothetical protein